MQNNVRIDDKAATEFHDLLSEVGWLHDYEVKSQYETEQAEKPIAYRMVSSIWAGIKPLYLMWTVINPTNFKADNINYAAEIVIALTFYANDPWLYNIEQETDVKHIYFKAYSDLMEALEKNDWDIEGGTESPEQTTEGAEVYAFAKRFTISKLFKGD